MTRTLLVTIFVLINFLPQISFAESSDEDVEPKSIKERLADIRKRVEKSGLKKPVSNKEKWHFKKPDVNEEGLVVVTPSPSSVKKLSGNQWNQWGRRH